MYGDPRGRLYEVWEVYGDLRGVIEGRLYGVWEEYGEPRRVIWCRIWGQSNSISLNITFSQNFNHSEKSEKPCRANFIISLLSHLE